MPLVDAVLITYRTTDALAESIRVALGQTVPLRTLLIIDNNPVPQAPDLVDGLGPVDTRIEVSHYPQNLGPAGGFSEGVRILRDLCPDLEWILLLDDDDPLPGLDAVEQTLAVAEELPSESLGGIGLMGGLFSPSLLLAKPIPRNAAPVVEVDYLFGGFCLLYRADALADAGCCRPELFFRYVDLDQGLRLRRAGWKLYAAVGAFETLMGDQQHPKLVERSGRPRKHLQAPSSYRYYRLRNLVNIGLTYCRKRDVWAAVLVRAVAKPLASLPFQPVLALRVLALNLRAVADGLRGRLGRNPKLEDRFVP